MKESISTESVYYWSKRITEWCHLLNTARDDESAKLASDGLDNAIDGLNDARALEAING